MRNMTLPELLVPAGGREQLESAVLYGADAVYLGGSSLSLRAKCEGFDGESLKDAVKFAHNAGVRVYYCLNVLPFEKHLNAVRIQLENLPELQVDGIIAADPGVIRLAKKYCPDIPLHLSTQAHSGNSESIAFWQEIGVSRINLARELGLEDIQRLSSQFPEMEFEVFVHGAMCLSLSGHCLLSAWVNNRPANLGLCTQPCRFDYRGITLTVEEGLRNNGEPFWDVRQGEDFSGIWAPMDLCLVRWIKDIVNAGAIALKIEGRTKSGSYAAQVADVYRTALNQCGTDIKGEEIFTGDDFVHELQHTASRPLCSGFFFPERQVEKEEKLSGTVLARVSSSIGEGSWELQVRSPWDNTMDIVLILPGMKRPILKAGTYSLENHKGERTDRLNPGMTGVLHTDISLQEGIYIRVADR